MKESLLKKTIFCLGLLVLLSLLLTHPSVKAQVSSKKGGVKKVRYTGQGLRDPFRSPFEMEFVIEIEEPVKPAVEADLSHLKVQGMVWGSKLPQAIINNTLVRVGEIIEGAEILDIRKEGIYVLYEGRQYIIRPRISKKRGGER